MTAKVVTSKISGIGSTLGQVSVSSGHTFEVDGVVDLSHCTSQAFQLPTGTTSQRPQNPLTGYLRWNTDTDSETGTTIGLEYFNGTEWWNINTAPVIEEEDP